MPIVRTDCESLSRMMTAAVTDAEFEARLESHLDKLLERPIDFAHMEIDSNGLDKGVPTIRARTWFPPFKRGEDDYEPFGAIVITKPGRHLQLEYCVGCLTEPDDWAAMFSKDIKRKLTPAEAKAVLAALDRHGAASGVQGMTAALRALSVSKA